MPLSIGIAKNIVISGTAFCPKEGVYAIKKLELPIQELCIEKIDNTIQLSVYIVCEFCKEAHKYIFLERKIK